ncbi:MAG: hypothetical protein AB9891_12690 [Anaerolineaceae bacterium]
MHNEKFLTWFTQELSNLEVHSKEPDMFERCQKIIDQAIIRLNELLPEERTKVHDILANYSSSSYMIEEYQIPYDKREEFDFMEEVLGTLEAYLRD